MQVIHFNSHLTLFFTAWMEASARSWSKLKRINVCLVDWSYLALSDYISAASTYTKDVGNYIAEFIRTLNIPPKNVSVAGHSLGAQIAGYCGAALNGKLGYIYGKNDFA